MVDPFRVFCQNNERHELLFDLRLARHAGNRREEKRLVGRIQADGWKKFLASTKPADTTQIYKYIRTMDGRQPTAFAFPCATPLIRDSVVYTGTRENVKSWRTFSKSALDDRHWGKGPFPKARGGAGRRGLKGRPEPRWEG